MPYRVLVRFGMSNRGWTETYWRFTGESPQEVADAAFMTAYITARRNLLTAAAKMLTITVIDVDDPRASGLRVVNQPGLVAIGSGADYVETAFLFRCTSQLAPRSIWVRGVPDDWVIWDGTDATWALAPTAVPHVTAFSAAIVDQFSVRSLRSEEDNPWFPVLNLQKSTFANFEGYTAISTTEEADIPGADVVVYFRGLNFCLFPGLRGQHLSLGTPGAGKFLVQQLWPDDVPAQPQQSPASFRWVDYDYSTITAAPFLRISDHDTGRPTNLPAGRSRGRSCRRSVPVVG